ncbi:hypothetical protein BKA58DRAFT_375454, partial [Alternaria rosae]|uniref:uncharacterized protein n=1 Tax=Alternaria rosae TaxID=1187941 RepID=UPI001E8E4538
MFVSCLFINLYGSLALALKTPLYHRTNSHHPLLAERSTTVEIVSGARGDLDTKNMPRFLNRRFVPRFASNDNTDFDERCTQLVEQTSIEVTSKERWVVDVDLDHQQTFVCILLVLLVGLKVLHLGNCAVHHLSFSKRVVGL